MNTHDFVTQGINKPVLTSFLETETSIFSGIYFDLGILEYHKGATCFNSTVIMTERGDPAPFLAIITAPESAWIAADTSSWESWIWFHDRAGAEAAHRLARWLLRGNPNAPLNLSANFGVIACSRHMEQATWKRAAAVQPGLIKLMPLVGEEA